MIKVIEENGDSLAFVWLSGDTHPKSWCYPSVIYVSIHSPGIHFATGHVFDMKEITRAAHSKV